ncbi:TPA: hypothetical protein DDW35_13405, partial [Candidatus Sumerlaeota bacterium]|nr:hypothetical protein [Candidatus Sumerlaeota bacterium]
GCVAGTTTDIELAGRQLLGPPAAQRRAAASISFSRGSFSPADWKGYTFNNDSDVRLDSSSCGEQTTDDQGIAKFRYPCNLSDKATFPLKATITGRVYEISGRAVAANTDVMVFPTSLTLGLMLTPQADSKKIDVSIAAVQPNEKPADLQTAKVTIEHQMWGYYVRRYYNNNEPNWGCTWEATETRDVALQDGKGATTFDVPEWGYYRVRVYSPETRQFSTQTFYSYYGKCRVEDAARPTLVKISMDKPSYKIGDTAEVRIESPYDGKAFIVLQGNALEQLEPIKIEKNVGIAKFKIKPEHFPNLWLEATAVHSVSLEPMQASPFSSFAAAPIKVDAPDKKLKVSFPNLQKEIRPDSKQTIEVEVLDTNGKPVNAAELTLAAVDEGIHLWTGYKTPNPYEWLTRLRRPDLKRNHYYDKVAYEDKKADIGGDQMAKRLGKGDDNWIKPVALWSGPVTTDKNGRVKIELDIPEYDGELRLVAVALNQQALGSTDSRLPVRRPYMLQTGQPRFLLPNDTFQSRTVFFNTTDAPCKVRIGWATNGNLKKANGEKELEVAAKKEAEITIEFAASDGIGASEIIWTATVLSADDKELDKLTQKIAIPVNIPSGFETKHELVTLKPGESKSFAREGFLESDQSEVKLSVGPDALLRLQKAFKYAIDYPYGCVEQTTSKLLPLYVLRHAKAFLDVSYQDGQTMSAMINAGIERLFSMQTGSGGLAYWPGGSEPNEYGSIYALHCLTLIKNDREFKIPEDNFKALQAFVRKIVTTWDKEGDHYLYDRAYATYVLALGGDIDGIQQIARFDAIEMPKSARMLLAAALAKSTGDVARVQKYLKEKPVKEDSYYHFGGDFYSTLKNSAVELIALQQTGEDQVRRNDLA